MFKIDKQEMSEYLYKRDKLLYIDVFNEASQKTALVAGFELFTTTYNY